MNGKSIPSEYPRASAFATRLRSLVFKPRLRFWLGWIIAFLVLCLAIFIEAQTSLLQSWIFTSTNERLFYSLEDGPSRAIAFPRAGPFDERRGYSKLPAFQARLTAQNYRVTRQARQSETMLMLEEHGVSPPYPERPDAGLEILGADGAPLLVKTLLFLENRDLDHPATPWQNPVIEWDRTLKAVLFYIGAKLHLPVP